MILYHGTSASSASRLMAEGWSPRIGARGSQPGDPSLLYLTNFAENAHWYAERKDGGVVLEVALDPVLLLVDPDDGSGASVEEELGGPTPGSVVLPSALPASAFRLHRRISASEIDVLVRQLHPRREDFDEGDLLDRIYDFDHFVWRSLDLESVNLHEFEVCDGLVDEYAQMYRDGKPFPPIVFDAVAGSMIDGVHRAHAAHRAGVKNLDAWLGTAEFASADLRRRLGSKVKLGR